MKKIITLLFFLSLCGLAFSKPVDEKTAKLVGQNFLASKTTSTLFKNGISLELSFTSTSKLSNPLATIKATNYFYVFNVSNGDGYVIVSADDNAAPILGYSDEVDFNPNNIPINAQKWFESYKNEIRYIIQNNISSTNDLINDWKQLVSGKVRNSSLSKKRAVSPLIQTKWNQSPFYNALCPYDISASERTVTGCVATAMAQVMKYWNYPATGTGSHSYNHSKYGTLSANFGATTYNWSSMPNRVTSSNNAVATLMYHCGVSVDMNYGVESSGAFGAIDVAPALKTYFGYPSTVTVNERKNYTSTQWMNLLKAELDAGQPMYYEGTGNGSGHAFVCDGYDNNNFFHFNWGWDGLADGYYNINALNPTALGIGSGLGSYNSNQKIVSGVKAPTNAQTLDMRLYSAITINPNSIQYGNGFTVTANFANFGANASKNFNGDFAAAIFNSSNQFVSYIQVKTGYTLNFNSFFTNPIVFTTNSISALTPGNYAIGVYYKPTGTQQWIAFANGSYQNFKSVEVKGNDSNPLKLYAAITTTPNIITRNQTFTVNFDVANFATSTFNGEISVDIHKSDGTWIRELSNKTGLSLPANTHFTNGLTYTITNGINDSAGTYQFFVWSRPSGSSWEFLGNGSFSNPINVQIKDPSLIPDIYEPNNTKNTAFNLPISFSGNAATKTSIGSNIHLGTDYDYYKIALPSGFNYSIEARLHDSYNSSNSQTYTVDGLISYSTDGTTWSDAFDDIISDNILVNGGSTLYFMVSPYFTGSTGTYVLDAKITRSAILSSEKEITAFTTNGIVGQAILNSANGTINLNVSNTTDITSLSPIISVSNFASVNPNSGTPRNFTNPVTYTVTAQDASTKQWTVTVTKLATGLNDISLSESINIYPNPSNDQLFIDLNNFKGLVNSISLFDIQGKEVFRNDNIVDDNLQLNNLNDGIYVVHIATDKGAINRRVIVQK
jgi:hypothetical protein